ncbi:MAG TPA: hypothetical protein VK092_06785, partial [Deinococcales bacterium]|nr:hypothetical protein [Deinococcales bacterium]
RQPIYVWRDFVGNALRGRAAPPGFPVPDGIEFRNIDLVTGGPGNIRAAFREGTEAARAVQAPEGMKIQVALDSRTDEKADSDTPPEHIQYIEVAPDELYRYLW